MNSIIENLKSFNRKERFYLIGTALGNPDFKLDKNFRDLLGKRFNLQIPENTFVAMDYHLDWLYASIVLLSGEQSKFEIDDEVFKATQEDIDLLVAYKDETKVYIILLEAKGVEPFTNSQLESKFKRFTKIVSLGNDIGINFYFATVGPKIPQKIQWDKFNNHEWALVNGVIPHIELSQLKNLLLNRELKKLQRVNEKYKKDRNGRYWKVVDEK
jgi:hypothetical protein